MAQKEEINCFKARLSGEEKQKLNNILNEIIDQFESEEKPNWGMLKTRVFVSSYMYFENLIIEEP